MFSQEDKFKIWKSDILNFNKWRRENDLNSLFKYIMEHSESFNDWMTCHDLNLEDILDVVPSRLVFTSPNNKVEILGKPVNTYFYWRELNNESRPFIINNSGKEFYDFDVDKNTISYHTKRRYYPDKFDTINTSILFEDIQLVKLGGINLASDFGLFERNLDFLDLDDIVLNDRSLLYSGLDIFCSSINNLSIVDSSIQFFKFSNCYCSNLKLLNSHVYNFKIENSYMYDMSYGFYFEKSKIDKFYLVNTRIKNIWMFDTQIRNFTYNPRDYLYKYNKSYNIRTIYENVRTLRIAFESMGNDVLASEYYYMEKNLKRKCLKLFINDIDIKRKYGGPYHRIVYNWLKRNYTTKNSIMYIGWLTQYYFRLLFSKEYHMIMKDYLFSLVSWIIWGYGEKPIRIIRNSLVAIVGFAALYYFSSNTELNYNIINSIYYSVITFTTLGYGDITPTSNFMKIISSVEAIIGAFSLGLIVAGYTIKARN